MHATQINSRQEVAEAMGLSLDQISARIQGATSQSFRKLLHTCRLKNAMQLLETTEIEITPYRLAHRLCHCAAFQPRLQQYRRGLTPQIPPAKTTRLPVLRSLIQIAFSLELPFKFFKSLLQHR